MKRGEVWWANIPKPVGRRPVVLLSRDAAYAIRRSVTVAPITRTIHDIPVEVPLGPSEGLPKDCVVNLDDIITISKRNLDRVLTTLLPAKMVLVDRAIKFALDLR
ncbi:MAG: type II toxin-antitoxin system PemK/MazF family toxin [Terriglobia bacterium]